MVETVRKIVEHEVDSLPVVRVFLSPEGEERLEVVGKISKTNIARLFRPGQSLIKDQYLQQVLKQDRGFPF